MKAWEDQLRVLREEFDASFAHPVPSVVQQPESVILAWIGDEPFVLEKSEVAEIHKTGTVMPLPGASVAVLGLTGLSGAVLAVASARVLAGLLPDERIPPWMVVASAAPIAFAFDRVSGLRTADRLASGEWFVVGRTVRALHLSRWAASLQGGTTS
jgi:hypothetical protein